jgi:hypothetical protein
MLRGGHRYLWVNSIDFWTPEIIKLDVISMSANFQNWLPSMHTSCAHTLCDMWYNIYLWHLCLSRKSELTAGAPYQKKASRYAEHKTVFWIWISCLRSNEPCAVKAGPQPQMWILPRMLPWNGQNWRWAAKLSLYNKCGRCWGRCAFTLIFQTPGYKNKINHDYKHS